MDPVKWFCVSLKVNIAAITSRYAGRKYSWGGRGKPPGEGERGHGVSGGRDGRGDCRGGAGERPGHERYDLYF